MSSGASGLKIEELKERTKVTDSQLDEQIGQKDMLKLSAYFSNVQDYMTYLELTPSQQRDIKDLVFRKNTQSAMAEALRLWGKPNPPAATYRALIKIVLKANEGQLAIDIFQHLRNITASFIISIQPEDVCCKPGEKAEFSISTLPSFTTCTYQWYFENQAIVDSGYEGQQSQRLLILKFFPKHKGNYWCIVEDKSGTRMISHSAALTAGMSLG